METAIFGNGCFWCTESIFQKLEGVETVESGYSGGHVENPTYNAVCSGNTGHAEVIKISYDPGKIDYSVLLKVFFETHDPTTLNRQGNDIGTQYRSVIFYKNEEEKNLAATFINQLNQSGIFKSPIVTELAPEAPFYKAEDYHQNYFNLHGENPYCQVVIRPKLEKFLEKSRNLLKQGI